MPVGALTNRLWLPPPRRILPGRTPLPPPGSPLWKLPPLPGIAPQRAAAGFVQGTGLANAASADTVVKAFGSNVAAGNLLVALCVTNAIAMPAGCVTDSQGNVYTRHVVGTGNFVGVFSAIAGSSAACTVTLDGTGSEFQSISIVEFSPGAGNVWDATRADGTNSATGSSTSPAAGSITITAAGVVVGVMTQNEGAATITPSGSWLEIFEDESTAKMPISGVYQISTSGAYNPGWTMSASRQWKAASAAFKPAASGGAAVTLPQLESLHRGVCRGVLGGI